MCATLWEQKRDSGFQGAAKYHDLATTRHERTCYLSKTRNRFPVGLAVKNCRKLLEMLAVATSNQERANYLLINGKLTDVRFVVPLSLNEGATGKSENMVIPAHRFWLAIVKSTNLLTEEEAKEVLNNFADNRWPRSSVFATPEAVQPFSSKKNFLSPWADNFMGCL